MLCCNGFGLLGNLAGVNEGWPDWYIGYSYASTILAFLIYASVIGLLMAPASNAYFRPATKRAY